MMKRAIAALLFLLCATPALAGRVAVIRQFGTQGSESQTGVQFELSAVKARLDWLGVDYDVLAQGEVGTVNGHPSNFAQAALRTGTVYLGRSGSVTRQYVGMIHMGFAVGASNRAQGYNPDTLTRGASWASIPHMFMGPRAITGGGVYSSSATCSTGMVGSATIPAADGITLTYTSPGYDEAFKVGANASGQDALSYYHNGANSVTRSSTQHGIFKSRLISGGSSAGFNDNGNSSAQWPDSTLRATDYFTGADTTVLWTRQRSTDDAAPLIFATMWNFSGTSAVRAAFPIDMAIALMDSATGGQVIGQKPGWRPPQVAFVVSGAFTRSESDPGQHELASHGVQIATMNDSNLVKAGIDSLKALGIPVTVTVNIDSVAAFPYEKAWWAGIPRARFAPEARVGTGPTLAGAARLADRYSSPDLFGFRRTRSLGTYGQIAGTETCDDTDTSLVCLLKFTRFRLDSIPEFNGRVGRFIMAAAGDYLHNGITRAANPGEDTLVAVFRRAGFEAAGMDVIRGTGQMASSWKASGGADVTPQTGSPHNFQLRQRKVRAAHNLGDFKWLAFRAIDEDNVGSAYNTHPIDTEAALGMSGGIPWYMSDLPFWNHEFRTKTSIYMIRPGDLGFQASATANPVRPGYHQIRWLVSQIRLVNKFAGRTVIYIGYPEDIEP